MNAVADTVLSIAQVVGTQLLILVVIDRVYKITLPLIEGHQSRQRRWLDIQRELELARLAQGTNLLGPAEIRISPRPMSMP